MLFGTIGRLRGWSNINGHNVLRDGGFLLLLCFSYPDIPLCSIRIQMRWRSDNKETYSQAPSIWDVEFRGTLRMIKKRGEAAKEA